MPKGRRLPGGAAARRRPWARRCPGGRRTAAVAHGVVVAAGQQVFAVWGGGLVAADHVAHGVDLNVVEAAVAHPVADALGAGAVGIGQVGNGELAFFGVARLAALGQAFLPVPDVVAQRGLVAELVVQADFPQCGGCCEWPRRAQSPGWLCRRRARWQ